MLSDKVLVPLDGSELAERILVPARRLLRAPGATAALLRVVGDVEEVPETAGRLEAVRDRLVAAGIAATSRVVVGAPAERILQAAVESSASLIAIATHARAGVARAVLGSVAEEVLRAAPVPVLVANPTALASAQERPIRKVLVALDGSSRSVKVLPAALEAARLHGAELLLLHALDLSWAHYPEVARPHELAHAEAFLARQIDKLDVRATWKVVEGAAADTIIAVAEKEGADLVAIATHGRSGAARWLYGSVAEAVLRTSRVPLLVVRSVDVARR